MNRCTLLSVLAAVLFSSSAVLAEDVPADLYDLVLVSFENKKQAVRAISDVSGMSLREAAPLVEALPKVFDSALSKENAEGGKAHAEKLGCKIEIKPYQPGASALPVRKFDVVLLKAGAKTEDVQKTLQTLTGKDSGPLRGLPLTVLKDQLPGQADKASVALTAAGGTVELVGSGSVDGGGFYVSLAKLDPVLNVRTLSVIRAHTGLSIARARAVMDSLPHVVKIKMARVDAVKLKEELDATKALTTLQEMGR